MPYNRGMWTWPITLIGAVAGAVVGLFAPALVFKLLGIGTGSYEDVMFLWLLTVPGGLALAPGLARGWRHARER